MDDFLEQMLSTSAWGDGIGMNNRGPWDIAGGSTATSMAIDSITGMSGLPKLSTMPLMPPSRMMGTLENPQGMSRALQEGNGHMFESSQGEAQDASHMPAPRLAEGGAPVGGLQLNNNNASSVVGGSSRGPQAMPNNKYEGPAFQQPSHNLPPSPMMAPTWRPPASYMSGTPPMPAAAGQGKSETFTLRGEGVPSDVHLGKRPREEDDVLRDQSHPGNMVHVAQPQGIQSGQGFGDQPALGQDPNAVAANGAVRPRVRARRGQATDPHSIAERNRRERIAERMKALQELVPDSNKTDKASMLDEIIGYVKFLQMQVKCLSMCRLGGAGAAAPLLADLPAEGAGNFLAANLAQANGAAGPSQDGMAFAERQVARLMDEDMSAAMQYLQSKGLCLMPISLATAISSTGARQPMQSKGDGGGNMKQAMELQVAAASGSTNPAVMAALAQTAMGRDGMGKSGTGTDTSTTKEDTTNDKASNLPPLMKGGMKNRDDPRG